VHVHKCIKKFGCSWIAGDHLLHSSSYLHSYARILKLKNQVRLVVILRVVLAFPLVAGLSIALQEPLYTAQSSLTTTYSTQFANAKLLLARFNDSQGTEMAFFNFVLSSKNQSEGSTPYNLPVRTRNFPAPLPRLRQIHFHIGRGKLARYWSQGPDQRIHSDSDFSCRQSADGNIELSEYGLLWTRH